MKMFIKRANLFLILFFLFQSHLVAETRIGDITKIRGIDENLLSGFGVVIGVNGKGDKGNAVKKIAQRIISRMGNEFDENDIEARNMALVHVTATLKPFTRVGQRIDIKVAAQGAESLEGGILYPCLLYLSGTDPSQSKPIVVAQGPILVGNTGLVGRQSTANSGGASIPTVGMAVGGGVVVREVPQNYLEKLFDASDDLVAQYFRLVLSRPNFTNASEISKAINNKFARELIDLDSNQAQDTDIAAPISAGEVMVTIPRKRWSNIIEFISIVQRIALNHVESEAVVVVNEKTAGIAMTGDIKLNACTVSYNGTNITIVKDQDLAQVLQQLNAVLNTKDQIEIIKTLHSAGHLRAVLRVE